MHPAIFIGSSVVLGVVFALQQWMSMRMWNYQLPPLLLVEAWGGQYLLWGVLCWVLWRWVGARFQRASFVGMITWVLPLSIATGMAEEMIWVVLFPQFPLGRPRMGYWQRIAFQLNGEFIYNLVIFWSAFALFRGIGYYQKFREKERTANQLEVQLVNAKLSALRMQLNPHFLFNTMNSISSLMRMDIEAADRMLEQLGSLLRMTLERGGALLIPLRDEVEFTEMYLALQDKRSGSRVKQTFTVDPELHDALVPAMILQPLVENAYAHGLSRLDREGILEIEVRKDGECVQLTVVNSGAGLAQGIKPEPGGLGVGLANIKSRLQLHYGRNQTFLIRENGEGKVQVKITLPFELSRNGAQPLKGFGAG